MVRLAFWTQAGVCAPRALARLQAAVTQLVSDNTEAQLTPGSTVCVVDRLALYAAPCNYSLFASLAITSGSPPRRRPILLDLLLNDVFVSLVRDRGAAERSPVEGGCCHAPSPRVLSFWHAP
jgi:hypothetical protein